MAQQDKQKAEPSGYRGDNPATAGDQKNPAVRSQTPENQGGINPSAPNQSTNESGNLTKSNEQALGSVGYGGENKPMAQPDGTAADLNDDEVINAGAQKQGKKSFRCADVGYGECEWGIEGNSEQEMLPKIKEHAARVHHLEFKPEAEQNVHRAIRDAA